MTAAELAEEQRTKDLLERASMEDKSADTVIREVQDAGIYKAAEQLRKAKMQAATQQQQKILGSMDLMLRAPAPKEDQKQKQKQPLSTQVSQKDMDAFISTLSPDCGKQFSAIIEGSAPAIHTFGEQGANSTAGGCGKLDGSLCHTEAQIEQAKSGPAGREMRSTQQVTGDGCLPSKCTGDSDLGALAGFMQEKAKEAIPGTGVVVKLSVDCSGSGGATAQVGFDGDTQPARPSVDATLPAVKSGAARAGGLFLALVAFAASATP